jgi:hypothetical protein
MKLFKEGFETMSALLAVALLVNLAARVAFAAMEWRHVDKGKYQKTKFLIGALVYMVEYNTGQRMMKATLKEKQRGGATVRHKNAEVCAAGNGRSGSKS